MCGAMSPRVPCPSAALTLSLLQHSHGQLLIQVAPGGARRRLAGPRARATAREPEPPLRRPAHKLQAVVSACARSPPLGAVSSRRHLQVESLPKRNRNCAALRAWLELAKLLRSRRRRAGPALREMQSKALPPQQPALEKSNAEGRKADSRQRGMVACCRVWAAHPGSVLSSASRKQRLKTLGRSCRKATQHGGVARTRARAPSRPSALFSALGFRKTR